MGEQDSLSQLKIFSERTLGNISGRRVGVEYEACSVRKDSIVDVSVLHNRSCIMPFAVNDEPEAQQSRCDEEGPEGREGGGHRQPLFLAVIGSVMGMFQCYESWHAGKVTLVCTVI